MEQLLETAGKIAKQHSQILLFLTLASTAFAWLYRTFLRPRLRVWKTHFESLAGLTGTLKNMQGELNKINYQLYPNGGGSVFDKLVAIGRTVADTNTKVGLMQEETRVFLDLNQTPILKFDAAGLCTYANQKFLHLAGLQPVEAKGVGWLRGITGDRRQLQKDFEEAVKTKTLFVRDVTLEGGEYTMTGSMLFSSDGFVGIMAIFEPC